MRSQQMWWFFSARNCSWVWLLSLTVFSSLSLSIAPCIFILQSAAISCQSLYLLLYLLIQQWTTLFSQLCPFLWQYCWWCICIVRRLLKILKSLNCIFAYKYVLWANPPQVCNLTLNFFLLCYTKKEQQKRQVQTMDCSAIGQHIMEKESISMKNNYCHSP